MFCCMGSVLSLQKRAKVETTCMGEQYVEVMHYLHCMRVGDMVCITPAPNCTSSAMLVMIVPHSRLDLDKLAVPYPVVCFFSSVFNINQRPCF
jgi:hypothetical protein